MDGIVEYQYMQVAEHVSMRYWPRYDGEVCLQGRTGYARDAPGSGIRGQHQK